VSIPEGATARNAPGVINGREFSGHALDRMQGQGIMPSVVEQVLGGAEIPGKRAGTTAFYDPINDLTAIINSRTRRVITVDFGRIRQ